MIFPYQVIGEIFSSGTHVVTNLRFMVRGQTPPVMGGTVVSLRLSYGLKFLFLH